MGAWAIRAGFAAVFLLAQAGPAPAAPPDGAMLANGCTACHGTGGVSAGDSVPSLAGQSGAYFLASMQRFASGERPATVMDRLARGYTEREIRAMAGYFAARKAISQDGALDARLVQKGLKVYYERCKYCHLDGALWRHFHQYREYEKDCNRSCHVNYGADTKDEVPLIAGQWPRYLQIQLDDFRSGRRKMSPRKAQAFKGLSREDMDAVAQFYASQKDLAR